VNKPIIVNRHRLDGALVETYQSLSHATRAGYCASNISRVLAGTRRTANGWRWSRGEAAQLTFAEMATAMRTRNRFHVRNVEFSSYQQLRTAGYDPDLVRGVLNGSRFSHAKCEWERAS